MESNTVKKLASLKEAQSLRDLIEIPKEARDNWISSRYSLYKCLKSLELDPKTIEDLSICKHLYLASEKSIKVSISHTKDFGAAVITNSENILSVGIDIEHFDRRFPDKANKYVSHEQDQFSGQPIELWSIKEACFKAAAPILSSQIYLTSIAVNEGNFSILCNNILVSGTYELEVITRDNEKLLCATSFALETKDLTKNSR